MGSTDYAVVDAWTKVWRSLLTTALVLSALLSGFAAFIVRTFYGGEEAKLTGGLLLLFAGAAVAVAVGFRRVQYPSWKHWFVVAVLAIPGGLFLLDSALR